MNALEKLGVEIWQDDLIIDFCAPITGEGLFRLDKVNGLVDFGSYIPTIEVILALAEVIKSLKENGK